MRGETIIVPPDHPLAAAVVEANGELAILQESIATGNDGRARVCARRAVGAILRAVSSDPSTRASHSLATLRTVEDNPTLPPEPRDAARRLQMGPRDGAGMSADPLADALTIINYFLQQASS